MSSVYTSCTFKFIFCENEFITFQKLNSNDWTFELRFYGDNNDIREGFPLNLISYC